MPLSKYFLCVNILVVGLGLFISIAEIRAAGEGSEIRAEKEEDRLIRAGKLAPCCLCTDTDVGKNICLKGAVGISTCDQVLELGRTKNPSGWAGVSCSRALGAAECQKVPAGLCNELYDAETYKPPTGAQPVPQAQTAKMIEVKAPKLNVDIPGLTLTPSLTYKEGEKIAIPFLAQYIAGLYRYLLGIVVITAAVMIVYGGFKYILAASSSSVKSGKETITDALIGLGIAFGAYAIFATINPGLVALYDVELQSVKKNPFEKLIIESYKQAGGQFLSPTPEDQKSMSPPYDSLKLPPAASCGSKLIQQDVRDAALKAQKSTGVPAAVILAQWALESAYGKSCIGKEGKKNNCFGVKCRVSEKYEGRDKPFSEGDISCPDTCTKATTQEFVKGELKVFRSCFQDLKAISFVGHASVVKRSGWNQYNGTPQGFARFVESNKYSSKPGYSITINQIMKDQCLL